MIKKYQEMADTISDTDFNMLPLVAEGESKEIRYAGDGYTLTRLKPTVYSFTHNRCGIIEGSDVSRMRATAVFLKLLEHFGINHAYKYVGKKFVLGTVMLEDPNPRNKKPFFPNDINMRFKKVVPLEIIVKRFLTGTTKHQMKDMSGSNVRSEHPMFKGFTLYGDEPLPYPIVRFDWRNPLKDANGERLDDKALPEDMADMFIDTKKAKRLALEAYSILSSFLAYCDIVMYDVCLFVTSDGSTLYGEISQDCGRFRHFHHGSLDKDVWRAGGSSESVLEKWNLLADIIEQKIDEYLEIETAKNNSKSSVVKDSGKNLLYIGTSNPYKVSEIVSIFPQFREQIKLAPEDDVLEDGHTFKDNARIKARAYARLARNTTLAEDSGIIVEALGEPGIFSARFFESHLNDPYYKNIIGDLNENSKRDQIDAVNRKILIEKLKKLKNENQDFKNVEKFEARFICDIAISDKDGNIIYDKHAEVEGYVILEERGNKGFGYDAIFVGKDTDNLTYAELDSARKNLRSHRYKALMESKEFVSNYLSE